MRRKAKKWTAGVLTCAMVGSCLIMEIPSEAKNKTTGFTISKAAGTYTGKVSVKVKAKKGYTVYYTTGKKLTSGKKIKSKKTKTFTFTKTKTLRVYAVKKKLSKKKLKKISTKKMKSYQYKIVKNQASATSTSTAQTTSAPSVTATAGTASTPTSIPVATPGDSQYTGDDSSSDYIEPVRHGVW